MKAPVIITSERDEIAKRRVIYNDVEELLVPGFLTQQVVVADVSISMKSMFPGEIGLLRNRIGLKMSERSWREWYLASAIWMVDGQVLLGDVNAPVKIRQALLNMPKSALDALFSVFTAIHNRVRVASSRVEAFCYEDFGRSMWRMTGRSSPSRDEVAGIPGISSLGMNSLQKLWVAFNLAEDDRQAWNLDWAMAKLVASATSPKGVKKLNQKDEGERKLEEERRQEVINRVYYEATGLSIGERNGRVVRRSVTPQQLVDEMDRWVRGERDEHDEVIEAYKNRVRAKHEADRLAHEERMRAVSQLRSETGASHSWIGYSPEQLKAIRGESTGRKGTPIASSSDRARLYERYLANEITAGSLSPTGLAVPIVMEEGQSLTETISDRRVVLSDGGGE